MTLNLFAPRPTEWDLLWESVPEEGKDPMGLRWFQREAHDAIWNGYDQFVSQLLVLATGLGKTQTFCALAKSWIDHDKGPVLILAHRDELVQQAQKRYEQMFGGFVDIEQGDWRADHRSKIVVGSFQSFHKKRLDRLGKDRFSLVIADEAHHVLAPGFRRAFEWFNAKRLGVTATPDRGDEKAMGDCFDNVAYCMDILDGIEHGYLTPYEAWEETAEAIDISKVGISKTDKDLDRGALDEAMVSAVEGIAHTIVNKYPNRKGPCFFPGVRSAEYAMHAFNRLRPDSAVFVSGETDKDTRRILMRDFKAGRYQYLCNCDVATEGFDAPTSDMVVPKPTLSRAKYAQMAGRGGRVLEGTVDKILGKHRAAERRAAIASSGKPNCLLLDFVGNGGKHTLVAPEDLLGGNFTQEEVEHAKKSRKKGQAAGDPVDVQESLKAARRELEQLAKAAKVKVTSKARPFDPFTVFAMNISDEARFARFGSNPATEGQVAALRSMGFPDRDLEHLSKRAASRLFDEIGRRRKANLANYKQMRQLQKFGVMDQNIPFARASEALDYIAKTGWGKTKPIDPAHLNNIVLGIRQPGE